MLACRTHIILLALLFAAGGSGRAIAQSENLPALDREVEQLLRAGKFSEAIPLAQRALEIAERQPGPNGLDLSNALQRLAILYVQQGQYANAEPLYKRTLALKEKALGPQHTEVGTTLFGLASLYVQQARYGEAEPLYKRVIAIKEHELGAEHNEVATALYGLAALYVYVGRYEEAEPLYRRTIEIKEKVLGPNHTEVGSTLSNLAVLLVQEQRFAEAEPLYKRAIAIKEQALGPEHTEVGSALYGLAQLYAQQGRQADAEPLYRRVLDIKEKQLGPEHTEVGTVLYGLAGIYLDQGRYAEAQPIYERVLTIKEKALGPDHPETGTALSDLADLYFRQQQWAKAVDYWRRSTDVIIRRTKRGTEGLEGQGKSEAKREGYRFAGVIKASFRQAASDDAHASDIAKDTFTRAQWAQNTEAASSLEQMAVRQAKGGGALAGLVRERQDLVRDWQAKDKALVAAHSMPPELRNADIETALAARLNEIDARVGEIDRTMARDFPDYAAFSHPEPLTIPEVQSLLRANEALIFIVDTENWNPTPEESFIWAVTKTEARWVRSELGTKALAAAVAALRCGLDQAAWEDDTSPCNALGNPARGGEGQLPFDLGRAYSLYQALFAQLDDLIKDKQLLIAPSGPLTALPFQVLVTAKPAAAIPANGAGYGDAAWLIKEHAVSILPSVASLKILRRLAKSSKAMQPFIGFGNPLLSGPNGADRSAWTRQSCKTSSAPIKTVHRGIRGNSAQFFDGALANVNFVRAQNPLPETADELCAVAQSTGAAPTAVYLGERANETTIKALSASGALASARVIHFATHGLLAAETAMLNGSRAEPALLLSPPEHATEEDDGLLTASEVSQLKLDADWVVLSACNTAAGGSSEIGAEALSGLARAFFYAGARALLVSHWAVNSDATVRIVTKAFDELRKDGAIGRAEALRRSMLALIAARDSNAHPALWAPFIVAGEGAN